LNEDEDAIRLVMMIQSAGANQPLGTDEIDALVGRDTVW
jgi:hypothetical protein